MAKATRANLNKSLRTIVSHYKSHDTVSSTKINNDRICGMITNEDTADEEKLFLLTSICRVGGYVNTIKHWGAEWESIARMYAKSNVPIIGCGTFCPIAKNCSGLMGSNIVEKVEASKTITVLENETFVDMDTASDQLSLNIEKAWNSEAKVTIVEAPTGVGKSTTIINEYAEDSIIACQTHKLKDEMVETAKKNGNHTIKYTRDIPSKIKNDPSLYEKVLALFALNKFKEAREFILENDDSREAKMYVTLSRAPITKNTVTTHAKAICSTNINENVKTIYDEDPINFIEKSKVFNSEKFVHEAMRLEGYLKGKTRTLLKKLVEIDDGVNPFKGKPININEALMAISTCDIKFTVPMADIITSVAIMDGNRAIMENQLPKSKQIMILTATPNPDLYKEIYGAENVEFFKSDKTQNLGIAKQFINESLSQSAIANGSKHYEEINKALELANLRMITHKKYSNENVFYHNSTGTNSMEDEVALAVIGTPHKPTNYFKRRAITLGKNPAKMDWSMSTQWVECDNRRFKFFTYNNKDVQAWHLHSVRTELIQAVGRARLNRKNIQVFIASDFILNIHGIEYFTNYDKFLKEIEFYIDEELEKIGEEKATVIISYSYDDKVVEDTYHPKE
jgi:hypothetical protein